MSISDAAPSGPDLPSDPAGAPPRGDSDDSCVEDIPLVEISQPIGRRVAGQIGSGSSDSPRVERFVREAETLPVHELRQLISRLMGLLPAKDRAALRELQYESFRHFINRATKQNPIWPELSRVLFGRAESDKLYSAPQRFDLATIFVVTAAYSLLFGLLSFLDFEPPGKIVIGLVITLVAVSQSLLKGVVNPRGVSIVVGAASHTLMSVVWFYAIPRDFYDFSLLGVLFYGLIVGVILGYASGVLVGGVFLVADMLRQRFGRKEDETNAVVIDSSTNAESLAPNAESLAPNSNAGRP